MIFNYYSPQISMITDLYPSGNGLLEIRLEDYIIHQHMRKLTSKSSDIDLQDLCF
jgi:hypothetical protein